MNSVAQHQGDADEPGITPDTPLERVCASREGMAQAGRDLRHEKEPADFARRVWGFFRQHPTIVLTLVYMYLSTVGIIYQVSLFRQFGLDILHFAQPGDFLLAALKQPDNLIRSVILLVSAIAISLWLSRRRPASRSDLASMASWSIIVLALIALSIAVPFAGGLVDADRIARGPARGVLIEVATDQDDAESSVTRGEVFLIGATETFAFYHDRRDHSTHAIPLEDIGSIHTFNEPMQLSETLTHKLIRLLGRIMRWDG